MAKLGIVRYIDSAHGKKIHGHTFKIEIVFTGPVKDEMVDGIDFHAVIPVIENTLKTIDKKYLNEIPELGRATVENIAIYVLKNLSAFQYATIYATDL